MNNGYLAEIRGFAGNFAPNNWTYCAGQLLAISQFSALFSLMGNAYGGDGRVNFALPDLRGRAPISHGQSPGGSNYYLGQRSGLEYVHLSEIQLPVHNHTAATSGGTAAVGGKVTATMKVNNDESEGKSPSGQFLALSSDPDLYAESDSGATLNAGAISVDISALSVLVSGITVQLTETGGTDAVEIMQPYLTINWIICIYGLYPSRS